MNRRLGLFILVVLGISTTVVCYRLPPVKAIIWVEGHITSDTIWMPVDIYRVIGDTYVDPGVTLTIQPGVHVEFADGFSLIVNGTLYAVGTPDKLINFTSSRPDPSPGVWNTIKFIGGKSESFTIKYSVITYSKNGITIDNTIGKVLIEKNLIYKNTYSGINIVGSANAILKDNTIKLNKDGITGSGSVISGIIVIGNNVSSNGGNGISLFGLGSVYNITVLSNIISFNDGSGVQIESWRSPTDFSTITNINISSNVVSSNKGSGVNLYVHIGYTDGPDHTIISKIFVLDNNISSNGADGVEIASSSFWRSSSIDQVTISDNSVSANIGPGISLWSSAGGYTNASISNVFVSRNFVSLNTGVGINLLISNVGDLTRLCEVTISGNSVFSNGATGISMINSGGKTSYVNNAIIRNNTLSSNNGYGVQLSSGSITSDSISDVVVSLNKVSSNTMSGIHIHSYSGSPYYSGETSSLSYLVAEDNIVTLNKGDGISLYSGSEYSSSVSDVVISRNNISSNIENGIEIGSHGGKLRYLYDVVVSNNTLLLYGNNGIDLNGAHLEGVSFDTELQNNLLSAGLKGIHIAGSIVTHLIKNSISYNSLYGIIYDGSRNNSAHQNDIYRNNYGMNVTNGATVDAENNYWSDPNGPYHPSLNPTGKGNSVNGNGVDLDFIPFLSAPTGHINERPIAILKVDKTTVDMNETVTFDATSSIDDGRIDYYFDFADGTNSSWTPFSAVTHKYTKEGVYNATLIVMDDFGVTSLDGSLVYVTITVVPEFPSVIILPIFMIATLLAVTILRRKRSK